MRDDLEARRAHQLRCHAADVAEALNHDAGIFGALAHQL